MGFRFAVLFLSMWATVVSAGAIEFLEKASPSSPIARRFPFLAKIPRIRPADGDYVVVVHGLTWARATMKVMGAHLHDGGYHAIEVHYPSRSLPIDEVVSNYLLPAVQEQCTDPHRRIHFVGHSMGCIMIRQLLAEHEIENLGHVVLLAAPNQGIEMVDFLTRWSALRRFLGDSVRSIGAGRDSCPNRLGPVDFSPGIIMGSKGDFPLVSELIPGEDDGVVRVASGEVAGMAEMIVLPTTHIRMPDEREVQDQTVHFLRHGRFRETAGPVSRPQIRKQHCGPLRRNW